MNRQFNETINIHIMENEKEAHDWGLNVLSCELYWWKDFFNMAFSSIQSVPMLKISFEKTKVTNFGNYVRGRNALGLSENININSAHLNRPLWDILITLLHEMCHSWQCCYGTPSKSWFHNKEFQTKMLEFGIVVNTKGCHLGIGDPFVFLLKRHGIEFNLTSSLDGMIKIPPTEKPKGKSKLKKWQCPCGQTARVGKKDFYSTCDLCGEKFELVL